MITEFKGDIHELRRWAVNRANQHLTALAPEPYYSWVVDLLPLDARNGVAHWVGICTPESPLDLAGDWVKGYPHIHTESVNWPPKSTTVITYLTAPEEGGEFALGGLSKDDEYTLYPIYEGLTVVCDAVTWHGVKPVKKGTRIALITTGHPE
jgi:hypothetical protein